MVARSEERRGRDAIAAGQRFARTGSRNFNFGFILTLLGACCWSFGGLFVRTTSDIDAWQIIFYRSWVVLVITGGYMALRYRSQLGLVFRVAGINALIAGVALGLAGLLFMLSLFFTTVAQAVFMGGIAPFASALLAWWMLGERVKRPTWIAMVVALFGLATMLFGTAGGGLNGSMLALLSAFCFSCYSVLLRSGQKTEMTASIIWNAVFLILFSGVVLVLPTGLRESGGFGDFAIGWRNLAVTIAMGLVQLSLGLALFTKGSKTVPAAELALLALAEPMLAPIWVWAAFGEIPAASTLAGGAIILSALAYRSLTMARR
jgi:drug/metabolite transporter (DMT)-like permease